VETQLPPSDVAPVEPAKAGFPRWIFVLIGVFVLCCCVSLLVIVLLTLLGPAIGNVFSSINASMP
jgi:hypothetical protein